MSPAADRTVTRHPLLPAQLQDDYRRLGHWEDRTLAEIVAGWAQRDPSRLAITGPDPLSYEELWRGARRLAGTLAGDVAPGEFVVAALPNSWQGVLLSVAASIAGVGVAPMSTRMSPAFASNLAEQVDARAIVLAGALLERDDWRGALEAMRAR